ncbi:MAG: hypothetical protein ACYS0I_06475 [Planctomycetota bacterium]|jgi:hypothetical protein
MKTVEDLKHFYDTDLSTDLKVLEQKRKKVLQTLICVGIALAGGIEVGHFVKEVVKGLKERRRAERISEAEVIGRMVERTDDGRLRAED